MNVPGQRKGKSPSMSSGGNANLLCQPCGDDGRQLPADGYCQTCDNFLCQTCFNVHKMPAPMKHHVLLDKSTMPQQLKQKRQAPMSTTVCPDHPGKIMEFYCPSHKAVSCSVCAVLHHKPCKVTYIPDEAYCFSNVKMFTSFCEGIDALDSEVDERQKKATDEVNNALETNKKAIEAVDEFMDQIVADLKQKKNKLVKEGKALKAKEEKIVKDIDDFCLEKKTEIQDVKTLLSKHKTNDSDLFVALVQKSSLIDTVKEQLEQRFSEMKVSEYRFQPDKAYENTLSPTIPIGKIHQTEHVASVGQVVRETSLQQSIIDFSKVTVVSLPDINVKSSSDENYCWLTGIVRIHPFTLLAADRRNGCVKMLDTRANKVTSELKLSSDPWDVAVLPRQQAAVTLPDESQIQVISTSPHFSAVRSFKVNGKCHGIDSTSDKLVVSFLRPGKVEVLDHHGGLLHKIQHDSRGQEIFRYPYYVTISREGTREVIHVSDFVANTITKMTADGEVLYTYRDKGVKGPEAIVATEDGKLLVCCMDSYSIHVVSAAGTKIRTMLSKRDLDAWPYGLCFCPDEKKLYVGLYNKNKLKVYQLKL